jgi:hypothetical protein
VPRDQSWQLEIVRARQTPAWQRWLSQASDEAQAVLSGSRFAQVPWLQNDVSAHSPNEVQA